MENLIKYLPFEINGKSCCILRFRCFDSVNRGFAAKWLDKGPNGYHGNIVHFSTEKEAAAFLKEQYEYWEKKKEAVMLYS